MDIGYYEKADEIVSKVKNGDTLFRESPHFNMAVIAIVRGEDPLNIIGQLCQSLTDQSKAFELHLTRQVRG